MQEAPTLLGSGEAKPSFDEGESPIRAERIEKRVDPHRCEVRISRSPCQFELFDRILNHPELGMDQSILEMIRIPIRGHRLPKSNVVNFSQIDSNGYLSARHPCRGGYAFDESIGWAPILDWPSLRFF